MTSSEPAPTLDRAHISVSPRLPNWRPVCVRPWSRPLGSCHKHHAGVEGALGARAPTSTPAARWSTAGAGSRRRGGHRRRSASPRQCHLGRPPEHVGAAARCRAAARRRPPTQAHPSPRPPPPAGPTHTPGREREIQAWKKGRELSGARRCGPLAFETWRKTDPGSWHAQLGQPYAPSRGGCSLPAIGLPRPGREARGAGVK